MKGDMKKCHAARLPLAFLFALRKRADCAACFYAIIFGKMEKTVTSCANDRFFSYQKQLWKEDAK